MILFDTNVVSEAMKPEPDPAVRNWLDEQAAETLYLSSVSIAELMFGIGALPKGKRKHKLTVALDGVQDAKPALPKRQPIRLDCFELPQDKERFNVLGA